MIKYLIEYLNKGTIKRVIVEAATYTQAYLFFMCKFPSDHVITEIKEEKSPAEA